MQNDKGISSAYYCKAHEAIDGGDFEAANQICLDAVRQFESIGAELEASEAYHLLGEIAYQQEKFQDAKSWFLKAISVMTTTDEVSQLGYARTCNNLAAAENALGEFVAAENWLRKSIEIKEALHDKRGLAASYHQLGVIAETQGNLEEAERQYLKSLSVEEQIGNCSGTVQTMLNLAYVAEVRSDLQAVEQWYERALQILSEDGRPITALHLGNVQHQAGDYRAAAILYKKAYELAEQRYQECSMAPKWIPQFMRFGFTRFD